MDEILTEARKVREESALWSWRTLAQRVFNYFLVLFLIQRFEKYRVLVLSQQMNVLLTEGRKGSKELKNS